MYMHAHAHVYGCTHFALAAQVIIQIVRCVSDSVDLHSPAAGHLTYECRNFIRTGPSLDISSTSSDDSEVSVSSTSSPHRLVGRATRKVGGVL